MTKGHLSRTDIFSEKVLGETLRYLAQTATLSGANRYVIWRNKKSSFGL